MRRAFRNRAKFRTTRKPCLRHALRDRFLSRGSNQTRDGAGRARQEGPRTAEYIRELVLKIARETGYGYTRILGELKKLGIRSVGRTTVVAILREAGIDPGPTRGDGSWDEFLKSHAESLWACDFLSKKVWTASGLEVKRVGPRAPNMNAYAERWVQTIKTECLDHFVVLGETHLRHIVSEFVTHYHEERPHQAKDNQPLSGAAPPETADTIRYEDIVCRKRLGGLLKSYSRKAA